MDAQVKEKIQDLKTTGHIKLAGENSLTLGEVVFTVLGVLIIMGKMPFVSDLIPEKYRLWTGIAAMFVGMWAF